MRIWKSVRNHCLHSDRVASKFISSSVNWRTSVALSSKSKALFWKQAARRVSSPFLFLFPLQFSNGLKLAVGLGILSALIASWTHLEYLFSKAASSSTQFLIGCCRRRWRSDRRKVAVRSSGCLLASLIGIWNFFRSRLPSRVQMGV